MNYGEAGLFAGRIVGEKTVFAGSLLENGWRDPIDSIKVGSVVERLPSNKREVVGSIPDRVIPKTL